MEQSDCGRFRCHGSKMLGRGLVEATQSETAASDGWEECCEENVLIQYSCFYIQILKWGFGVVLLPGRFRRAKCKQDCPSAVMALFALC